MGSFKHPGETAKATQKTNNMENSQINRSALAYKEVRATNAKRKDFKSLLWDMAMGQIELSSMDKMVEHVLSRYSEEQLKVFKSKLRARRRRNFWQRFKNLVMKTSKNKTR